MGRLNKDAQSVEELNEENVEAVEGVESGMVLQELQKGYKLKDRVIRPSMVKVSE